MKLVPKQQEFFVLLMSFHKNTAKIQSREIVIRQPYFYVRFLQLLVHNLKKFAFSIVREV